MIERVFKFNPVPTNDEYLALKDIPGLAYRLRGIKDKKSLREVVVTFFLIWMTLNTMFFQTVLKRESDLTRPALYAYLYPVVN